MAPKGDGYRRDKIARYLKEYTEGVLADASISNPGVDASKIAHTLSMDRANVSRDLNTLYRSGIALKLLGRPTRYLHYRTTCNHFPGQYIPNTIPTRQSLNDFLSEVPISEKLLSAVQKPTLVDPQLPSLRYAAVQAESAVSYPPYGLHTMLLGEYGIGRFAFAEKMFEYGKAIGRFSPNAKLHTFDCRSASNSVQSLTIQLFGCAAGVGSPSFPSRKGLVERADGSVLLLTQVQYLPPSVQEKLIDLISHNTFTRFGESSVIRQCRLMLIATSCKDDFKEDQASFLRRFPIHITIPSLAQRTVYERFLYLYQLFKDEASTLDCEFQIGKSVLYYLLCATFSLDIVTLRGNIKSICSLAYHEYIDDSRNRLLPVGYRHLSPPILSCHTVPDEAAEFLVALKHYPEQEFHIHAKSAPPLIPISPEENFVKDIPILLSDDPSLFHIKEYLKSYLRKAAQSFAAPIDTNPDVTKRILYCLQNDDVLGALPPESPLLQSMVDLFSSTLQPDVDYHSFRFAETSVVNTLIPANLKILADQIEAEFCQLANQKVSDYRASMIALYLHLIRSHLLSAQIIMFLIFHGEGVSSGLATYLEKTLHCSLNPISCGLSTTLESVLAELDCTMATLPSTSNILIFSDGLPFDKLHDYVEHTYALQAKTICGASFETIVQVVRLVTRFHFSLDMVCENEIPQQETTILSPKSGSLISQAVLNLLAPSLDFLDISKALPLIESSFQEINQQLSLDASDNSATKYQFHCAHMIERSIRKEYLDYPHLKVFFNQHRQAFRIIGNAIRPIEQSYGIHVPSSEIAYLVEIFLPL